jgi:hypothetical protein
LKLSYAIPKISLLRYPYLCGVLGVILVAEIVSLFLFLEESDAGGPGIALVLIFSATFNFVAVINSRTFEGSERRLYVRGEGGERASERAERSEASAKRSRRSEADEAKRAK